MSVLLRVRLQWFDDTVLDDEVVFCMLQPNQPNRGPMCRIRALHHSYKIRRMSQKAHRTFAHRILYLR